VLSTANVYVLFSEVMADWSVTWLISSEGQSLRTRAVFLLRDCLTQLCVLHVFTLLDAGHLERVVEFLTLKLFFMLVAWIADQVNVRWSVDIYLDLRFRVDLVAWSGLHSGFDAS